MSDSKRIWLIITNIFITTFRPVNVQFAMPQMFPPPMQFPQPMPFPPPPPPMFAIPAPQPIQVAVLPFQVQSDNEETTTTTTTTTTERNIAIAVPVPVPMPVQIAVPAYPPPSFCMGPSPRPKSCPPCPPCVCQPSCTPSFFSYCSPCHQKCRCRDPNGAPMPMPPMPPMPIPGPAFPLPMPVPPGPPPVVIVPYPPQRGNRPSNKDTSDSDDSSDSGDSDDDSSCSGSSEGWGKVRSSKKNKHGRSSCKKNKKNKQRKGFLRKQRMRQMNNRRKLDRRHMVVKDNELVRPVLTYINRNGDIKLQKRISDVDAADLMGTGKLTRNNGNQDVRTVQVLTGERKPELLTSSERKNAQQEVKKPQWQVFNGQVQPNILHEGRKQIVFKPGDNKKISNFSLSFQVT